MLGEDHISFYLTSDLVAGPHNESSSAQEEEWHLLFRWLSRALGCLGGLSAPDDEDERPMITTDCIDYPQAKKPLVLHEEKEMRWHEVEECSPTSIISPHDFAVLRHD